MAEQDIGLLSVYTAQPTIRVDGNVVEAARTLLLAMEVHEQEGGLSRMELRFSNIASESSGGASLAFADRSFDFGKEIAVYTGDENVPVEIFRGIITALESEFPEHSEPEFVVLAEDNLQKARWARATKFYDKLKLADLVRTVAKQAGLTAGGAPSTDTGGQMQLNESHLAFLRRILSKYDVDAQATAKELQCGERQGVKRNEVTVAMHSQLRKVRVTADLAHQVTEVTVSGWNPKQGQKVKASSKGKHLGPGKGDSGSKLLQKIGARSEHIGHLAVASSDEAKTVADTAFDQRARGFVTLHATAEGNPKIRVGTHLTVTGLGTRFDNTYYVKRVLHRYNLQDGYKTDLCGECAFVGAV